MALDLSMRVLVVDDYKSMTAIVRALLRQLGFIYIDEVRDGEVALAQMHRQHYGLVISDWNMEPVNGYDLLCRVRSDPDLKKTPFILVTAESKVENVIAAKAAGVSNYIIKPFTGQALRTKIEEVFATLADEISHHRNT